MEALNMTAAGVFLVSGCNAELGGFAGLFDLKAAGFVDPILVSGTDGVGTKLKVGLVVLFCRRRIRRSCQLDLCCHFEILSICRRIQKASENPSTEIQFSLIFKCEASRILS